MLWLEFFVFMGGAIGLVCAGIWGIRASFRPVTVPRVRYTGGRHRAVGMSTAQQILAASRKSAVAFAELADATKDAVEFNIPAQTKGAYAHLRTEELDSTAERFFALVERGIRPPSPWGTPVDLDVWGEPLPAGVEGHLIGARGAA
jgi:hypothetical protein